MHAVDIHAPWTATEINSANYCAMRWFLNYVMHAKQERYSFFEKGTLLHHIIDEFWRNLGTKYKNPDDFGKYAQRRWMHQVIQSDKSENPIKWRFESEKWVIRNEMPAIGRRIYERLVSEGPPLFSEIPFDVFFDGIRYRGRIDAIRKDDSKIIIRDYKSGRPFDSEIKLDFDPQPTFYYIGVIAMAKKDIEFARMLGIEDEVDSLMTPGHVLTDRLQFEYVMLDDENLATYRTRRDDIRYRQLVDMITGIKRRFIDDAIYPEFGRKCEYCTVKDACKKWNYDRIPPKIKDEGGQMSLSLEPSVHKNRMEGLLGVGSLPVANKYNSAAREEQGKLRLRTYKPKAVSHKI